jgi:hypothetical protein
MAQEGGDFLVRGLLHFRAGRRPYVAVLDRDREKWATTLAAGAAIRGFALARLADDAGLELFVATRGAETIQLANLEQVSAWLDHLYTTPEPAGA